MSNSIYIDEATPWADLAKMDIPKFVNDRPVVPIFKGVEFSGEYPVLNADINYELKTFELEKLKYSEPCPDENHVYGQMAIWHEIEFKAMQDVETLRFNDIPVFNISRNFFPQERSHFQPQIVFEYQIPEVLMYKSFFVLHNFDTAVKKSGEYAMQQVQKIIDKY